MAKFKKDRNLLCFIILIVTAFPYPALAQEQKKEKKFIKAQYEMLKRCSDKRDMTEWNQWRKKNLTVEIWLEGAELNYAGLQWANLKGAVLNNANLVRAVLSNANLEGAKLYDANLQGAKLSDANLQEAWLSDAKLQEAWLNSA
ncbi:MAG: pentapeptide repeat-containing protein, partial [Desulfobacteraceae bacterium]|nr:pentapeptide repeat-containing protein [Desulfobacteraceae bacterium]